MGNIGAGELAFVRLTVAAPLPFTDGEATFRFPQIVAPRYIPGVKLGGTDVGTGTAADTNETPDASRITPPIVVTLPGFPDPMQLSIKVRTYRNCEPYVTLWPEERFPIFKMCLKKKTRSMKLEIMLEMI
jgi:hypothetical protein